MKINRKELTVYIITSLLTIGVVYIITADNADLRILRGFSRMCQGTAHVFGRWGLESERLYHTLIENGRMV